MDHILNVFLYYIFRIFFQSSKDRSLQKKETLKIEDSMSHNPTAPDTLTPAGIVPKAGAKVEPFHHIRKFFNKFFQEKSEVLF